MLTTAPFLVQWKKVWPLLGVAVTVCEVPSGNLPPPLTVPEVLGEALTVIVYGLGLTVSAAARVVFPWPFVVLLKLMMPSYVPGVRFLALTVKVMVFCVVVTVPDFDETVSQLGTLVME